MNGERGEAKGVKRDGTGPYDVTREELRTTFDYQVARLQEIDTKAIEILKANLLLIGILVTGGSILVQTDLEIAAFLNPFTVAGGLLLLGSTGLAAVTYTASDIRGGLDAEAIESIIAARSSSASTGFDGFDGSDGFDGGNDLDGGGLDERLIRSYAEWIDYNARVTAVNDLLATVTVVSVFVAFVYVIAGVAVGGAGLSTLAAWGRSSVSRQSWPRSVTLSSIWTTSTPRRTIRPERSKGFGSRRVGTDAAERSLSAA